MSLRHTTRDRLTLFLLATLLALAPSCGGGGGDGGAPPPPPLGFRTTTTSLPGGSLGGTYNQTLSATGGTEPYTWSVASGVVPSGLTLSSSGLLGGRLSGAGNFVFGIRVQDAASRTATSNYVVSVVQVVNVLSSNLPTVVIGVAYNTALQASGGTSPYAWAIVAGSGSLPPGLSLGSDGVISGTPLQPTSQYFYSCNIQATDSAGLFGLGTLRVSVVFPLQVGTTSIPDGNVGVGYLTLVGATGGSGGYQWSLAPNSGPLPAGLNMTFLGSLLQIHGVPTVPGPFSFSLQVTDQSTPPQVATQTYNIVIGNRVVVTTRVLGDGVVNAPYSQTLQAAGGTPPYSWSIVSGNLPLGLSLNPTTGEISGSAQQVGAFGVTVQVRDSASPTDSATAGLGFSIHPPPAFVTTSLPDAAVGVPYGGRIFVTGGLSPYRVQVVAGALPPGFTVTTGQFTGPADLLGTASGTGTFNFTVELSDSSSPILTATQDFALRINPRLIITTAQLPQGLEGQPYNATIGVTGGVPPYTFAAYSLPPGLVIDPNLGQITGTPTGAFDGQIQVNVGDSGNLVQYTSSYFNLRLFGKLRIDTTRLPPVVRGQPVRFQLSASGGTGPYTWTVVSGALPGGLNFTAGNSEISGTPTTVEATSFVLRVVDSGVAFPQSDQREIVLSVVPAGSRNETPATATPISGGTYYASISPLSDPEGSSLNPDTDYYSVEFPAGTFLRVETFAERLSPSSPTDSLITITDLNGSVLNNCGPITNLNPSWTTGGCRSDDIGTSPDSGFTFTVPGAPGSMVTFYVRVLDWSGSARPDFVYALKITRIN